MKIYTNGKIHTMDEKLSVFQAFAVQDGKIADLGESRFLASRYSEAEICDLGGRTVIPGLIDSHAHTYMAADSEAERELFIPLSVRELLDDLKRRVREVPPGEWVVYLNTYPLRLDELRFPTLAELDAAAPENPVSVDGFYAAQLNTAALTLMDYSKLPSGGRAVKDSSGKLTGTLLNSYPYLCGYYPGSRAGKDAYVKTMRCYNRYGITTAIQGFSSFDEIRATQELYDKGTQTLRLRHTIKLFGEDRESLGERIKKAAPTDPAFSRVCFIKDTIDGGFLTGTAYMEYPYRNIDSVFSITDCGDGFKGNYVTKSEQLAESIRLANKLGLQYCAHCVGSLAAKKLIEAYEFVAKAEDMSLRRHALLHADFLDYDMLSRAKKLGLTVLFQPAWHYMDAQSLPRVMLNAEIERFMPYADILVSGVNAAAGSDHMVKLDADKSVNPYNPFIGLYNMVSRRGRDGKAYGADKAIDRESALLYYTRHAARVCFDEDLIGTLEPGKRADFTVLDRDYFSCAEHEIKDILPVMTVLDGKEVYKNM
jgi:predicted amidohydrolase YtcJ